MLAGRVWSMVPLLAGVALVTPSTAAAPDAVATRQRGFRELGAAYKNVNDELKSGTPQAIILQLSARQIRDAARAQYGWFPAGSGPQPGVKTAAKAEIWAQPAQFKQAQDNFATQAAAFYKVVSTGEATAIQAQAKQLGAACGACHRSYRSEERP